MSAVLKLVQGTEAWRAHRAQYRNASESASVMGLSPWQTPYQLWLVRTGRMTVPVTAAMHHGTQMEPKARAVTFGVPTSPAAFYLRQAMVAQGAAPPIGEDDDRDDPNEGGEEQ